MILQRKFKIDKSAKILFFKSGDEFYTFNGREKKEKIIHWVSKMITGIAEPVSCDELDIKVQNNNYTLAFFGDKKSRLYTRTFEKLAF